MEQIKNEKQEIPETYYNTDEYPSILTVKDIQNILRISKDKSYELVNSNQFKTIKIGKAIRIPKQTFIEWLHQM